MYCSIHILTVLHNVTAVGGLGGGGGGEGVCVCGGGGGGGYDQCGVL